jgi:hypothetical protein
MPEKNIEAGICKTIPSLGAQKEVFLLLMLEKMYSYSRP